MRSFAFPIAIVLSLWTACSVSRAAAQVAASPSESNASTAALDAAFVCPEALPDDAARMAALKLFMDTAAKALPSSTLSQLMGYRRALLIKHKCTKTLLYMESQAKPLVDGNVLEQAWEPLVQDARLRLFISTDRMRPILDPRTPGERAVEVYAKLVLPAPRYTDMTHTAYDTVVSRSVYYCRSQRYALVENDYFLAGKATLKDASKPVGEGSAPVYDLAPIPPGSLNARTAAWACAALKSDAA